MIVMKFGGSSVKDAVAVDRVSRIIASRIGEQPVVVVSAMGDTTDDLLGVLEELEQGRDDQARTRAREIAKRHLEVVDAVLPPASIQPAVAAGVPVRVLNSYRVDAPGTAICSGASDDLHDGDPIAAAKAKIRARLAELEEGLAERDHLRIPSFPLHPGGTGCPSARTAAPLDPPPARLLDGIAAVVADPAR